MEKKPISGLYGGLTGHRDHARGVEACEFFWNKEIAIGTFDSLLIEQLEQAEKAGRKSVDVLDLGSGDAALFTTFLNNAELGEKTRQFLATHPDFTLNLIGLTDASQPEQLFQEIPLSDPELTPQIQAKNILYTLSVNQRLTDFMEHLQLNQADLIVSTWMMTYLGPNTFRNLIKDIMLKLRENGGKFIGTAYAEQETPGFIRKEPGFPHDFDNRGAKKHIPSPQTTLVDSLRFTRRDSTLEIEEENLRKAEMIMHRIGILSLAEIATAEEEFQQELKNQGEERRYALLNMRRHSTIVMPTEILARQRQRQLHTRKMTILQELQLENSQEGRPKIGFRESTIVIEK